MKKINQMFTGIILSTLILSACAPDPNLGQNQVTTDLKNKLRQIKGVIDIIEPPKSGCLISLLIAQSTDNSAVQLEANQIAPKNVPVCVHYSR